MAEFTVNTSRVRQSASVLSRNASSMAGYQRRIQGVAGNLSGSLWSVRSALIACGENVGNCSRKVRSAGSTLESCMAAYDRAENNVKEGKQSNGVLDWLNTVHINDLDHWNWTNGWSHLHFDPSVILGTVGTWPSFSPAWMIGGIGSLINAYKNVEWDKSAAIEGSGYSRKWKPDDDSALGKITKEQKDIPWKKWTEDENGNRLKDPDSKKWAKKNTTYLEFKEEAKVEGSLLHGELSGDNGWANGKVNADVGKAEAHMEASAGLYGYDSKGNRFVSPQINAKMGASFCAVTAAAEGMVGNELFNVGGKGEVSAGKVSAEGEATVVFRDKDGHFNPQAKLEGSAEAVAFEAKGSVSGTVVGIKATGEASFVVGAGAHAKFGVVDGCIKCDVGASLGIGFSLGFEIDTKPLVNAVTSGAQSIWNTVSGWFK